MEEIEAGPPRPKLHVDHTEARDHRPLPEVLDSHLECGEFLQTHGLVLSSQENFSRSI